MAPTTSGPPGRTGACRKARSVSTPTSLVDNEGLDAAGRAHRHRRAADRRHDGSLVTDELWGVYYKPDFNFGGVQGGAMPWVVQQPADDVAVDPYGEHSTEYVVTPEFERMWTSALAHCHKRFEGKRDVYRKAPTGGIGAFTPDSFPVFDTFSENVYVVADSNHGYKMIGVGALVAKEVLGMAAVAARTVPLLAVRARAGCIPSATRRTPGAKGPWSSRAPRTRPVSAPRPPSSSTCAFRRSAACPMASGRRSCDDLRRGVDRDRRRTRPGPRGARSGERWACSRPASRSSRRSPATRCTA